MKPRERELIDMLEELYAEYCVNCPDPMKPGFDRVTEIMRRARRLEKETV